MPGEEPDTRDDHDEEDGQEPEEDGAPLDVQELAVVDSAGYLQPDCGVGCRHLSSMFELGLNLYIVKYVDTIYSS